MRFQPKESERSSAQEKRVTGGTGRDCGATTGPRRVERAEETPGVGGS